MPGARKNVAPRVPITVEGFLHQGIQLGIQLGTRLLRFALPGARAIQGSPDQLFRNFERPASMGSTTARVGHQHSLIRSMDSYIILP